MGRKIIKKNKIAFFDFPGHPFVHDLTKELSRNKELDVYHLYNPKQLGPKSNFKNKSNEIIIKIPKKFSRNFYIRFFDEIIYSIQSFLRLFILKPDVLIVSSFPLIPLFFISLLKPFLRVKLIFWMQDIQSVAIVKILSRVKNPLVKPIASMFYFFESFSIKKSDSVIMITDDFKNYFVNELQNKKTYVINNWGSLKNIKPLKKDNNFTKKYNLEDSFNILYSGTLGYKHNPDVIIKLAKDLKQRRENIKIIIVSEGPVVDYIKREKQKFDLNNILILPFQDFEIFSEVLASSEVNLVLLEKDSSDFCVPSKFLSILCAGKIPIVNVSSSNLVSKIISDHQCGISFKNQKELSHIVCDVMENYNDYLYLGVNGRKYAENNFDLIKIKNEFLKIIQL